MRPIFRFWTSDGEGIDRIAPGPVAGAGIWVGRVSDWTVGVSVSPTSHLGLFNFAVESIRLCSHWSLLAKGWRQEPLLASSALFNGVIGSKPESDVNLNWATAFTPLKPYEEWRDLGTRPVDLQRIDAIGRRVSKSSFLSRSIAQGLPT